MKKLGVTQGLLIGLLATLVASCGSSSPATDARVDGRDATTDSTDSRVDTRTDARVDTQPDTGGPDLPATDVPATDVPAIDVPAADVPAADVPATDVPATDVPATDVPATDGGTTDVPATDVPVATYLVGGTVSGLVGSGLVLRNNGGDNLTVTAGATSLPFTFATRVPSGGAYAVTVLTQPSSPTQLCTVANAAGTVGSANVTNVTITCSTQSFSVGGTVSGLTGTGLVLRNNGSASTDLPVSANGTFAFTGMQLSGTTYSVAVQTQPSTPAQICTLANATGTVGGANVTNVAITCATQAFSVGGTVSGLTGTGLVLRNSGGNDLTVATGATTFMFSNLVATGAAYAVTVFTQPAGQNCSVTGGGAANTGTGTIASANVTNVVVTCVTSYAVGGTITGLAGTGLVLRNTTNGSVTSDVTVTSAGASTPFTFTGLVPTGGTYAVSVVTQPTSPTQICVLNPVGTGTGTVTANVTTVAVTCTTQSYAVGGAVSNLTGAGLILQNTVNGTVTTMLPVSTLGASVSFAFAAQPSSSTYAVTVSTQPAGQNCVPSLNTGTVGGAAVNTVAITCTNTTFSLGGTINGLTGTGLVLRNTINGSTTNDTPAVTPNAGAPVPFTFTTRMATAATYAVSVQTQPTGQNCVLASGATGTVASADLSNVVVTCSAVTSAIVCGTATNGNEAPFTITCPGAIGQVITSVRFVSYGTPDTTTCGSFAVVSSCHTATPTNPANAVSTICLGFHSCTIMGGNAVYGDPCPGPAKTFAVEVVCQ